MTFSMERDDYLRSPGRRLDFYVGPFFFYVSTADEGWLCFEVQLWRLRVSWEINGRPLAIRGRG